MEKLNLPKLNLPPLHPKSITTKQKADELFTKFRTQVIDSDNQDLNDETANTCALICARYIQAELDYYCTSKPRPELRSIDLSGRDFWKEVNTELQNLHKTRNKK